MMKKFTITLAAISFLFLGASGQDAHFTNFRYAPSAVNPAFIGMDEEVDFNLVYRNQWSQIADPFTSVQFTADYPLQLTGDTPGMAAGLSYALDRSGESGSFLTNRFNLMFSKNVRLAQNHYLSLGIQSGVSNQKITYGNLTSGSQWVNGGFDPTASINEPAVEASSTFLSGSVGILYFSRIKGKENFLGLSVTNFGQPVSGFVSQNYKLSPVATFTGGFTFLAADRFVIRPQALLVWQAKALNILAGSDLAYQIGDRNNKSLIGIGAFYRVSDGLAGKVFMGTGNLEAGLSYDMNMGPLSADISRPGSFELFLNYKIGRKKKEKPVKKEVVKEPEPEPEPEPEKPKTGFVRLEIYSGKDSSLVTAALEDFSSDQVQMKQTGEQSTFMLEGPAETGASFFAKKKGYFPEESEVFFNTGDTTIYKIYLHEVHQGEKMVLDHINFKSNSDVLEESSFTEIARIARFLKENPDVKLEITGHTDDVGSHEYNQELSSKRARAIVRELLKRGIDPKRLVPLGKGETEPLVPNDSEENRHKNRRVEMKVLEE